MKRQSLTILLTLLVVVFGGGCSRMKDAIQDDKRAGGSGQAA